MFTIKVEENLKKYCRELVNRYNFWQRWIADWSKKQQWFGCIWENVIRSIFNKPWLDWKKGFDWGYDIIVNNLKIDIKTMGRKTYPKLHYVNNLIWLQKKYDVDVYIFCSYNYIKSELTICGRIEKEDFFKKASLYKKWEKRYRSDWTYFITKADLYEIKNNQLHKVESEHDLVSQIISLSIKKKNNFKQLLNSF